MAETILIPDMHIQEIEKFIQDDFVKREFKYKSVQDFVIQSIEGQMEADKDIAGL